MTHIEQFVSASHSAGMLLALPVLVDNMAAAARTSWATWSFITVFTVKSAVLWRSRSNKTGQAFQHGRPGGLLEVIPLYVTKILGAK